MGGFRKFLGGSHTPAQREKSGEVTYCFRLHHLVKEIDSSNHRCSAESAERLSAAAWLLITASRVLVRPEAAKSHSKVCPSCTNRSFSYHLTPSTLRQITFEDRRWKPSMPAPETPFVFSPLWIQCIRTYWTRRPALMKISRGSRQTCLSKNTICSLFVPLIPPDPRPLRR